MIRTGPDLPLREKFSPQRNTIVRYVELDKALPKIIQEDTPRKGIIAPAFQTCILSEHPYRSAR